jgi:hypothetical protein
LLSTKHISLARITGESTNHARRELLVSQHI